MPVRPNKFTAITGPNEVASWLGAVIQEKVAKENAGLVEISVQPADSRSPNPEVTVCTSGARHGYKLTIETVRRGA